MLYSYVILLTGIFVDNLLGVELLGQNTCILNNKYKGITILGGQGKPLSGEVIRPEQWKADNYIHFEEEYSGQKEYNWKII